MDKKFFIIDFDSTFIKTEGLDELAEICLKDDPKQIEKNENIKKITSLGMEGKISFSESLKRRLDILTINKKHLETLSSSLLKKVSDSIKRNKSFFNKFKDQIYVISGGFKDYVVPVVEKYHISPNHIFANSFIFNKDGKVIGYDKKNPLSHDHGKIKILKNLKLDGKIYCIGDGYTDYELKEFGIAQNFTAFIENVKRDSVVEKADKIAPNFDEFLYSNNLPTIISYPKNRLKTLLLENIDNDVVKTFEKEGYEVEYFKKALPQEVLIKKIKETSILGIRSQSQLTADVLMHANRLLTVGAFCIGTNQVDLPFASSRGISVFNAPYSNTRSVVELIIGEIIMLSRNIFPKNTKIHQGIWEKTSAGSHEIRGKTLGIIGYGNIGSQLSVLAETLGMNVIFFDEMEKLSLGNAKKCRTLKELLVKSDFISIHVDGRQSNRNLIGEKEFNAMKDGVIFLNASRGFIVDIPSLVKNLKSGKIRGAAIDVYPKEPKNNQEKFVSSLQNIDNVILTPHVGGSTEEAQKNIGLFVGQKIIDYVNTGDTTLSVNFPNIHLPSLHSSHRLLHIHKNVPGILANINNVLAKNNINIEGQFLKTNEEIGYAVTDVNKKYDKKVIQELKNIDNTIRFRVLY